MTSHHHDHAHQPTWTHHPRTAEHWEERYSGEQMWSGSPNGALVAEVADLTPGRALDIGSGEGADSVWLASHGWQVTALDVAHNAIARTLAAAQAAGVQVETVVAPFTEAGIAPESFDLVSAMYPVLWKTADNEAERRLFELVAPGGTLLFVHHDLSEMPAGTDLTANGFDPAEILSPDDVRACLPQGWTVVTDERRERHVTTGSGAGHSVDLVLRVQRAS